MEEVYLQETSFLDYSSPLIQDLIKEIKTINGRKEQAIALFYKVRDGFRYDPYHLYLTNEGLKASTIMSKKRAWCVEKAIVLAAGLRGLEIPSRLGYGVVVNHIGVEKLTHYLRREEIVFHGYVDVYLDNQWVKTTPAFDPGVCRIAGVPCLEWDGENDAMFQAYNGNQRFMEYIHFYGTFSDVPLELMISEMKKYYPHLFERQLVSKDFTLVFEE